MANVKESQAKSKERFDKKSKEPSFALHDRVLLRCSKVPTGRSPKLFERFDGPFYITGLNYTYKLKRGLDHKPIKSPRNATRLIYYKDPYIMRDMPDQEIVEDIEEIDDSQMSTEMTQIQMLILLRIRIGTYQMNLTRLMLIPRHKVSHKKQIHLLVSQMIHTMRWRLFSR